MDQRVWVDRVPADRQSDSPAVRRRVSVLELRTHAATAGGSASEKGVPSPAILRLAPAWECVDLRT